MSYHSQTSVVVDFTNHDDLMDALDMLAVGSYYGNIDIDVDQFARAGHSYGVIEGTATDILTALRKMFQYDQVSRTSFDEATKKVNDFALNRIAVNA